MLETEPDPVQGPVLQFSADLLLGNQEGSALKYLGEPRNQSECWVRMFSLLTEQKCSACLLASFCFHPACVHQQCSCISGLARKRDGFACRHSMSPEPLLVFSIRRDPGTVQASTSLEIVSVIPLPYLTESFKYGFLQMLTGICTVWLNSCCITWSDCCRWSWEALDDISCLCFRESCSHFCVSGCFGTWLKSV